MVEGAALEKQYTGQLVSWVRIPLSPPDLRAGLYVQTENLVECELKLRNGFGGAKRTEQIPSLLSICRALCGGREATIPLSPPS